MAHETSPKIYPRNPRYVLQLHDKKVLRFAPYPRGSRSFYTEIHNLSESGMAFTVPYLDVPNIDETIMVEFTPPGEGMNSIACFGHVKRVQNYTVIEADFFQKNCKLVAVKFSGLQPEQTTALRQALDKEFKKINLSFSRQQLRLRFLWMLKFKKRQLFWGAASLGVIAASLALSLHLFFS